MELKFYRRAKHSGEDNQLHIQTEECNFMQTSWKTMVGQIHKFKQILQGVKDLFFLKEKAFQYSELNFLLSLHNMLEVTIRKQYKKNKKELCGNMYSQSFSYFSYCLLLVLFILEIWIIPSRFPLIMG